MKHYEDDVRRRYQSFLVSRGVDSGRVELEVLYWLPGEFIEAYREIFEKALDPGGGSSLRGSEKNAGLGVGIKDGGRGKGKKSFGLTVRNEDWLDVKKRVDRKIMRVIQGEMEAMGIGQGGKVMGENHRGRGRESHGSHGGRGGMEGNAIISSGRTCKGCGRFMKGDWTRCPYCND